jgi:hypothetical protein
MHFLPYLSGLQLQYTEPVIAQKRRLCLGILFLLRAGALLTLRSLTSTTQVRIGATTTLLMQQCMPKGLAGRHKA